VILSLDFPFGKMRFKLDIREIDHCMSSSRNLTPGEEVVEPFTCSTLG
jgi:hypothetical protein